MVTFRHLSIFILLISAMSPANATEELTYSVLHAEDAFEIRQYDPYLEAYVEVPLNNRSQRSGSAFRLLAGYIFGNNIRGQKIAMTAPVINTVINQDANDQDQALPSSRTLETATHYRMAFSMPAEMSWDDMPRPGNDQVKLQQVQGHLKAAVRYSGNRSRSVDQKSEMALLSWLSKQTDFQIKQGPYYAGYDSPWTPANKRRNEVMYILERVK